MSESIESAIDAWARTHAHPIDRLTAGDHDNVSATDADADADLQPLRQIIGNAHLVSFGEGLHGGAEPLDFRNRLFRFLVEQMGFTAIVLESGITPGFGVNRYVLGGDGELADVVSSGLSFGFSALLQNLELVRWMRAYNDRPSTTHKAEFYGMDIPGEPENMQGTLFVALGYLAERDAILAAALCARIEDLVHQLRFNRMATAPLQYTGLDAAQRDRLSATINDLIAALSFHEVEYTAASSDREFSIAHRAAIAARQVDDYLRQVPIGWTPSLGHTGLHGTVAAADAAKADNVDWIRRQMRPDSRILLFAHRDHLAGARSTIRLPCHFEAWTLPPMVGEYVQLRYGADHVRIAHLFASEAIRPGEAATQAAAGSFEARLASLGLPNFLLDLRTAPPAVKAWLHQRHELFGVMPWNTTVLGEAHDAVLFSQHVRAVEPAA